MSESKKLKLISLTRNMIVLKGSDETESDGTEEVIIAPLLLDENAAIDDISELVDTVYEKFSEACEKRNLNWEAELEIGLEFGIKFSAKLKISPRKTPD